MNVIDGQGTGDEAGPANACTPAASVALRLSAKKLPETVDVDSAASVVVGMDQVIVDGFEVIAPDLPGHGESSAPHADYTATYFTDAVAGFLDSLGIRGAVLVGESIGGAVALALAARRTPGIARVVSLNPYDYGRRGGIRRS